MVSGQIIYVRCVETCVIGRDATRRRGYLASSRDVCSSTSLSHLAAAPSSDGSVRRDVMTSHAYSISHVTSAAAAVHSRLYKRMVNNGWGGIAECMVSQGNTFICIHTFVYIRLYVFSLWLASRTSMQEGPGFESRSGTVKSSDEMCKYLPRMSCCFVVIMRLFVISVSVN